ncbi:fibronectin type III domain-containing protein [Pseudomonas sp. BIC9C]|uniref:fibronectin type III domain-containing protein n=1 Tax=Pseudomonas sp. BIC9C TaxID=3078458 RepID=UPI002AD5578D|nr:fibronectin type III domain-containing protein [Pseudomonas sp. BIC9C]
MNVLVKDSKVSSENHVDISYTVLAGSALIGWYAPSHPYYKEYHLLGGRNPVVVPASAPGKYNRVTLEGLESEETYHIDLYGVMHNEDRVHLGEQSFRTRSAKIGYFISNSTRNSFKLFWGDIDGHYENVIVQIEDRAPEEYPNFRSKVVDSFIPGQTVKFRLRYASSDKWNEYEFKTARGQPTAPGYLGKFEHTINSVLLHWGPGTVDGGPVLYKVRRDELVLEETEDTAFRDLTPEQGRTYVYSVCTVDDQYNESERTTLTLSFDDLTPPTEISNLRTTDLSLQVLWDPAYDSSGRVKYHVYLEGDHKGTTEETAFSFTELESGKRYQICVEAEDASGNKSNQVCASYPPLGIPLKAQAVTV